jgi:hypothetical protein
MALEKELPSLIGGYDTSRTVIRHRLSAVSCGKQGWVAALYCLSRQGRLMRRPPDDRSWTRRWSS